jgi:hypothetical protein
MSPAAFSGVLGAILVLSGCDTSLDEELDRKACSARGECLPGFVCSPDDLCVPEGNQVLTDEQAVSANDAGSDTDPAERALDSRPADGGSWAPASCAQPTAFCGSVCVDLEHNPMHCGACERACEAPSNGFASCAAGRCESACHPGSKPSLTTAARAGRPAGRKKSARRRGVSPTARAAWSRAAKLAPTCSAIRGAAAAVISRVPRL